MIKGSWADVIENKYNTEKRCEKLFLSHLWPDGIECPRCKKSNRITNKISANKKPLLNLDVNIVVKKFTKK